MKENPMNPHIAALRCPHRLLDTLIERYALKNDAGLSRALEVAPPCISKIRRGSTPLSAEMMLRIHERFELPIATLRQLAEGYGRPRVDA